MDVEEATRAPEGVVMDIEETEEVDEFVEAFEAIDEEAEKDAGVYESMLKNERMDDAAVKIKEKCILRVARLYTEKKDMDQIMSLMKTNAEFFNNIAKAKTAKIVRNVLAIVATIPDSTEIQLSLCEKLIEWCEAEKRTFLKQRIEAKYSNLLWLKKQPAKALEIVNKLLGELKKLDDKQMLTEVHLTESRIYETLENIPKSKASLTAARGAANSIYVVPLLQAELDEMSGILCCEEQDYTTSFSYFQEAYDAYESQKDGRAVTVLKYMCLAKVLNDTPKEVFTLLNSKIGLKHSGPGLEALHAIAVAVRDRSLEGFEAAVAAHAPELKTDDLISHHLDKLYERMFENNLIKIITPFSSVEIAHVAKLINMSVSVVEKKLSQMILDKKVSGILDQGQGILEIFDAKPEDNSYTSGMSVISNMSGVVETLMNRGKAFNKDGGVLATKAEGKGEDNDKASGEKGDKGGVGESKSKK